MNRRYWIKSAAATGLASTLSYPAFRRTITASGTVTLDLPASSTLFSLLTMPNSPCYHFSVGNLKATVIGDGQAQLPAYPLYAVNASQQAVRQALAERCLPTEDYTLQCNVLYLDLGAEKVLIDTGGRQQLGPGFGKAGRTPAPGGRGSGFGYGHLTHARPP
jgi:hypothetical protein